MDKTYREAVADERPELLTFCGAFGILGALVMTFGVLIVQTFAPGHDPIEDTISDLARGDTAWIMDAIFYLNAASLLGLAIAAAHLHLGKWDWSLGIFVLALLALDIVLLGVWDTFYSTEGVDKTSVHTRLATALYPLFLIGPLLMVRGISNAAGVLPRVFIAASILWGITALIYFFGPEAYYGITERIAGATTLIWVLPLSWVFLRRGLARL
ncbi:DUF998 domain-containing protein [Alphaproteobacteria bacterium GH1-50]|uniref:DUF998 domain-containing protein n=1 Tax=Kangsaoukella pontilimi TaxID=2691042 RepID=A0A7C9MF91_9RHOB|nr:DUF998 domain-containing protein [Kangsaoukella pontilimi]MXQ07616.1 DUF998 domain-containing protein [Kangsaoukella pontilimi]